MTTATAAKQAHVDSKTTRTGQRTPGRFYTVTDIAMTGPRGRWHIFSHDVLVASTISKALADSIAARLNAHDDLVAALRSIQMDVLSISASERAVRILEATRAALAKVQS